MTAAPSDESDSVRHFFRSSLQTLRSYFIVAAGSASGRAASFVAAILIARSIGPTGFGDFSLFFAVFVSFVTATDFIDGTYVVHATRRNEVSPARYLRAAVVLKIVVLAFLVLAAYPLAVGLGDLLFNRPELTRDLTVAIVAGVLMGAVSLRANTFLAQERYAIFALIGSIFYWVFLILIIPVVLEGPDLTTTIIYGIIVGISASLFIVSISSLIWSVRPLHVERPLIAKIVRYGKWFIATQIILVLFQRIDIYLLARFETDNEVGQYGAALRLTAVISLMIAASSGYFLPRVVRTRESRAALTHHIREGLLLGTMLCAGIAVVWLLAPFLVDTLLGEEFEPAVGLTRILLLGIAALALSTPLAVVAAADDVPRHTFFMLVAKIGTLALGAVILIPRHSTSGAAWAFVASECVGLAYAGLFVWTRWRTRPDRASTTTSGA